MVTSERESSFSEQKSVETAYNLTEYEIAQNKLWGKEKIKSIKFSLTSDFLGDVASEVRAKSSFCGFKGTQGSGAITFDSITSDNNVNGAAINPEAGTVTIGADAAYQV